MLSEPDFEPEFYEKQIAIMQGRYAKIFKSWKLPWKSYIKDVSKRLRNRTYWIWNYLIGLESFIQSHNKQAPTKDLLEKDKDSRISRIVGDFYKVEQYVKGL